MEEAVRDVLGQVNKQLAECQMKISSQEEQHAVELIVQSPYVFKLSHLVNVVRQMATQCHLQILQYFDGERHIV